MKFMIFLVSMMAAATALADENSADAISELRTLVEAPKCESVTLKSQLVISRLYSVSKDAVAVTISGAHKSEGKQFIAVGADVRFISGLCTLAWKTDIDSCAQELVYLMCNQR